MNDMENLRFDKEGYFLALVFYGLFYKRNKNISPVFSYVVRNTCGSLEELEIAWRLPTGSCVSITVWKMFSIS